MGIISAASFAGSVESNEFSPRLGCLARGYTLAPADAGSPARVAQVANLRYKRTRANCLIIAIDD
jgi:hypothetical protein